MSMRVVAEGVPHPPFWRADVPGRLGRTPDVVVSGRGSLRHGRRLANVGLRRPQRQGKADVVSDHAAPHVHSPIGSGTPGVGFSAPTKGEGEETPRIKDAK